MNVGISSLGLRLPSLTLPVEELARLRGQDPDKFTRGLGCREIALCGPEEGPVELAVEACRRALGRWEGRPEDLGLLAVGTESALDMSRPLSAWIAAELGLAGSLRSYEVKHACYGGTLALRQALEWQLSGAAKGKAALVVAADVALYARCDPGEPTQGAGAVAMIVDSEGRVARIDPESHAFSEPAFDFWLELHQLAAVLAALDCGLADLLRGDPEIALDRGLLTSADSLLDALAGKHHWTMKKAGSPETVNVRPAKGIAAGTGPLAFTDAEAKAARRLGTDAETIRTAAKSLWHRVLDHERDARVAAQADAEASPRKIQALRGHVTRSLLAELAPVIEGRIHG